MNIRPTLSRITEQVSDPGVELFAQQEGLDDVASDVPVVEVREMDAQTRDHLFVALLEIASTRKHCC